ncbi:kallikrein-7-like [Pipistrellus kuhlii]|uniref:kallikrein-7-like n=1 Tax=Pipistrellus kuhlii TaxID=59472 RepID=UPI001E274AD4|nr:kallikrein-7-like [Pipistrellus kuhlii]
MQMGSDLLVDPNAQRIRATQTFVQPQFDAVRQVHDIMLVKLSSPATLSSTLRTINVPSRCKPAGNSYTASGWGSSTTHVVRNTSQLMCTKASILPIKECREVSSNMQKRSMLCAAPPNRRSSMVKVTRGAH